MLFVKRYLLNIQGFEKKKINKDRKEEDKRFIWNKTKVRFLHKLSRKIK